MTRSARLTEVSTIPCIFRRDRCDNLTVLQLSLINPSGLTWNGLTDVRSSRSLQALSFSSASGRRVGWPRRERGWVRNVPVARRPADVARAPGALLRCCEHRRRPDDGGQPLVVDQRDLAAAMAVRARSTSSSASTTASSGLRSRTTAPASSPPTAGRRSSRGRSRSASIAPKARFRCDPTPLRPIF